MLSYNSQLFSLSRRKNTIGMKNLIGYVIGGILLLMALGSFSGDNYSISTGLLFLLAGILCFPQIIRLVNISLLTKYSAVFIVILVVFALIIQNNNPIENQSDVTQQNNIENKNDSIQEVINASKKLNETLQREISNINKLKFRSYLTYESLFIFITKRNEKFDN